jgi:hypothetical protein
VFAKADAKHVLGDELRYRSSNMKALDLVKPYYLQCEGGSPCLYCRRRKFTCAPQFTESQPSLIFVNQAPVVDIEQPPSTLWPNVPQDTISRFANHFFTTFLVHNDFAGASLDLDAIKSQFQSTPSFYHAAIAVGALDLGSPHPSSIVRKGTSRLEALNAYRASIVEFQKEIQGTSSIESNACLWTTFFWGLFEVSTSFSPLGASD